MRTTSSWVTLTWKCLCFAFISEVHFCGCQILLWQVFSFSPLTVLFYCLLAFIVSLRSYVKSCGYSFGRNVSFRPLAPFKIFRLSLVLGSLSIIYFESILLMFLCDSWICELICFISFGKILSNSFFKYCFCHFLLTLSFCISGMERITFSLCFLPYILPWNHCASCLSVPPSGCFHLIFLPAFSSATSSLLSAIYTESLILLILLFNFTWIFFWCFSSYMFKLLFIFIMVWLIFTSFCILLTF